MDAIYRCATTDGKIVEIDADNYDSIAVIKGLAKIVHGVAIVDVVNEVICSNRCESRPITRLPDGLRNFIEKRMAQCRHLICHFSSYVMRHKIAEARYEFILDAMIQREKEESDQRIDDMIASYLARCPDGRKVGPGWDAFKERAKKRGFKIDEQ